MIRVKKLQDVQDATMQESLSGSGGKPENKKAVNRQEKATIRKPSSLFIVDEKYLMQSFKKKASRCKNKEYIIHEENSEIFRVLEDLSSESTKMTDGLLSERLKEMFSNVDKEDNK